jgi:hypothetical protein
MYLLMLYIEFYAFLKPENSNEKCMVHNDSISIFKLLKQFSILHGTIYDSFLFQNVFTLYFIS